MAAEVNAQGSSVDVGRVTRLVAVPAYTTQTAVARYPYDVTLDGQRVLVNAVAEEPTTTLPLTVVINWAAALKK
jgi:hypothetical protein